VRPYTSETPTAVWIFTSVWPNFTVDALFRQAYTVTVMNATMLAVSRRAVDVLIVLLVGVFLFGLFELNLLILNYNEVPLMMGWRMAFVYGSVVLLSLGSTWIRSRTIPLAAGTMIVLNAIALAAHFVVWAEQCPDCLRGEENRGQVLGETIAFIGSFAALSLATLAAGVAFAVGVRKFIIRPPAKPAGSHDIAQSEPAAESSASDLHARLAPQQN
jgi:hypothetical protein